MYYILFDFGTKLNLHTKVVVCEVTTSKKMPLNYGASTPKVTTRYKTFTRSANTEII